MSKTPPSTRRRGRPPAIATPNTGARVVKKYGNRRLYDTRDSRYVNLEELVDLFASEPGVLVLDATTGDDLTEKLLTQAILAEGERHKSPLLPTELLRAVLRYRRGPNRNRFERHLARAVAAFASRG